MPVHPTASDAVYGVGRTICRAVGVNPAAVSELTLRIDPNGVLTVELVCVPDPIRFTDDNEIDFEHMSFVATGSEIER